MNITQYLLGSAYSGISSLQLAASTCKVNGSPVPCPTWLAAAGTSFILFFCLFSIILVISSWKVFRKAGHPGWASIVPVYNTVVSLQIAGKPGWWVLLMFIPLVNVIVAVIATHAFAQAFGKGAGFTLGLIFLPFIFLPILAFGNAQYHGQTPTPQTMMA